MENGKVGAQVRHKGRRYILGLKVLKERLESESDVLEKEKGTV